MSTLSTVVSTATGCAPNFPIVQTVNKSPAFLAGFDLCYFLFITQVKLAFWRQPDEFFLVPFLSNRELCLAGVTEGICEILKLIREIHSV